MLIVGVSLLCMDSTHPDAVRIASAFVARQRAVITWPACYGRRDMRRFADIYPTFLTKSGSDRRPLTSGCEHRYPTHFARSALVNSLKLSRCAIRPATAARTS